MPPTPTDASVSAGLKGGANIQSFRIDYLNINDLTPLQGGCRRAAGGLH